MTANAKIFMHGRSQAVRLPKEFRLRGKEARVSRIGDAVLLEPLDEGCDFDAEALWAKIDALADHDFPAPVEDDLRADLDQIAVFE